MSVRFRAFGSGYFTPTPPTKLRRTSELLERKHGTSAGKRDEVARTAALAWFRRRESGDTSEPTRTVARGFASLYVRPQSTLSEATRTVLLRQIGACDELLPFVSLWALWELGEPSLGVVAARLAWVVAERRRDRRQSKRLAPWADVGFPFHAPLPALRAWVERQGLFLVELSFEALRLKLGSGIGATLLVDLIKTSSTAWWSRNASAPVRAWASERAQDVRSAVAERQLIEFGRGAESVADLPRDDEALAIKTWVKRQLGDPGQRPGAWLGVAPRAVEIFEWLLLSDELELIFDEFARSAEDDRAEFWRNYLSLVRDARFYRAHETAVCMLAFDNFLVIEFGTTANAAYFYERPRTNIRRLALPPGGSAKQFKSVDGLEIAGIECGFYFKMNHTKPSWQSRFRTKLEELGLVLGAKKRLAATNAAQPTASSPKSAPTPSPGPDDGPQRGAMLRSRYRQAFLTMIQPGATRSVEALRALMDVRGLGLESRAFDDALEQLERERQVLRLDDGRETVVYRYS